MNHPTAPDVSVQNGKTPGPEANGPDVTFTLGPPRYHADEIENILSWHTIRHDFALWCEAVGRFLTILGFFLHIMWMAWWDAQIWSYIGEDDIDHAQSRRRHRHGRMITERLLEFGPTFIKVGQSLSTRVDLLRKEYIEELSALQDRVPPFPLSAVTRIIEEELGAPPEQLFRSFDPTPLAAASLGQVHRVTLNSGEEAVIKIQRPRLIHTFQIDLAILKKIARFLQTRTDLGRGREWCNIVDEFGRTLFEEIDYIQEGRNAERFRRNFAHRPDIVIPKIYWRYTARRVIVMAYCPGIKMNDIDAIEAQGFSPEAISVRLVQAYFQQLLLDGFFHADPHPGNLVVDKDGRIVFYDFGMVGHIPDETRIKMVNTFLNIVAKKTDAILKNLTELEMIAPGADLDEIRVIIDWALDNYYDVPHDQLNFEELADEMAEVMYYYPFKLPASFTFMFRALITLEGVATHLYPHIQFMGIAVEYAKDFVQKTYLFDRLFSPDAAKNYPGLIKEGLELLGIAPGGGYRGAGGQKVRLYHEEWKPLARYIKAGFLLMGFGQTVMLGLIAIIFLRLSPTIVNPGDHWLLMVGLGALLVFYAFTTFATLLWLPARKKPFSFNPPRPKTPARHAPGQSGR